MISIAVTGGVACGKSHFCSEFADRAPAGIVARFSSDEAVDELWQRDDVLRQFSSLEGAEGTLVGGAPDRALLRQRAFANSDFRGRLEEILHPLVLDEARSFIDRHSDSARLLLIEVPLLYEVEFPVPRDLDVVIAASRATQLQRLQEGRGLEFDLANQIIDSQLPLDQKISRGDLVVWNDGHFDVFDAQIDHLVRRCSTVRFAQLRCWTTAR